MPRRALPPLVLASSLALSTCNAIGAIAGAPSVTEVKVLTPPGILVGDSLRAHARATKSNGVTIPDLTPDTWRSSDPTVISISATGMMRGLIAGRQATIFADFQGKTGSAVVVVGSDDARLAYALADQPSAANPYSPDPSTSFNSGGGAITATRTSAGVYTVRFAGLGRPPGGRDNVQVSSYGGTSPVYCKPQIWDGSGADLVVPVDCFMNDGTRTDSKFTILAMGARAFGATTPLGFSVASGTANAILDSSVTAHNSAGGQIQFGYISVGSYAENFLGLGAASGGASGPVGLLISPVGEGPERCLLTAYDLTIGGFAVGCEGPFGGLRDSPYSVLWLTRGRPGFRYGYAFLQAPGATQPYSPPSQFRSSSSGGTITSRKTAIGNYQVVFAGLARPPGATEIVLVSAFGGHGFCSVASWANSGGNDLSVNLACFDPMGRLNDANGVFNILLIQ